FRGGEVPLDVWRLWHGDLVLAERAWRPFTACPAPETPSGPRRYSAPRRWRRKPTSRSSPGRRGSGAPARRLCPSVRPPTACGTAATGPGHGRTTCGVPCWGRGLSARGRSAHAACSRHGATAAPPESAGRRPSTLLRKPASALTCVVLDTHDSVPGKCPCAGKKLSLWLFYSPADLTKPGTGAAVPCCFVVGPVAVCLE